MYPHHPAHADNGILIQPHPQQGRHSLDEHFCCCEFYYYEQRCYLGTNHNWTDEIHLVRYLDSCQNSNVLRTLCNQEKHVPACEYKFKRERVVATLKEHVASPSFVLMGGRPLGSSATRGNGTTTTSTSATTRPPGTGTGPSATCYRFGRSNGGGGTGGGTQHSGTTGRLPRNRNVRAIEASSDSLVLDDDLSATEPSDNLIMAKLNGDCLGGCDKVHPPCECPNLVGDVEQQKKTFASLSSRQRHLPVQAITTTDDDDDDVDLIDLHDPEDQDSDADQDFP